MTDAEFEAHHEAAERASETPKDWGIQILEGWLDGSVANLLDAAERVYRKYGTGGDEAEWTALRNALTAMGRELPDLAPEDRAMLDALDETPDTNDIPEAPTANWLTARRFKDGRTKGELEESKMIAEADIRLHDF